MTKNIIPTINISPIVKNGFDNSKSIIATNKIQEACINIGFFQITGHGISPVSYTHLTLPTKA